MHILSMILLALGTHAAPPPAPSPAPDDPAIAPPACLWSDRFTATPDQPFHISWRAAGSPDTAAWPASQISHAFTRQGGSQSNFDTLEAAADQTVEIRSDGPGLVMLGVTLRERRIAPNRADLARLSDPRQAAETDQAVPLITCSKILLRAAEYGAPLHRSSLAPNKTGQPAEIRPLVDPTAAPVGSDIPLRVLAGEGSRPGAALIARHLSLAHAAPEPDDTQTITANASGIAVFHVTRPGPWVLSFELYIGDEANPDEEEGEDEAQAAPGWYQATLSFEVPAP